MFSRPIRTLALVSTLALVAACDTAEERAEGHYQSSLELIEAGDVDRAIVELKNVFNLNGLHREARLTYAELMRDRGDFGEAWGHYLLLTEQYPDDHLPRLWLFRIALLGDNFEEAKKHGERAISIAPDDPEVQAAGAIMDYREAALDNDTEARRAAAARVREISAQIGDEIRAIPVLIDSHVRDGELAEALVEIEKMIADNAYVAHWQEMKLQLLVQLGEEDASVAHLREMVELFPDQEDYAGTLVQWLISRGDTDGAETFLRRRIELASPDTKTERQSMLVGFISGQRGTDAAISELTSIIESEDQNAHFRAMRAGLMFDNGERDGAIAEMNAIVDDPNGGEELLDIKTSLALMHLVAGDEPTARARIAEVLETDSAHVGALKRQAAWLIQDDLPDQAILQLRIALSRAPEDPEIMSLMSDAHLRNGSRNLAGEMLSLAVETSDRAPDRVLDYARFLMEDKNFAAAEELLVSGLRDAPENPELLVTLGNLYVATSDWTRAERAEATIRAINTPASNTLADSLRVDRLRAQNRGDEALRFLEELSEDQNTGSAAEIAIARTHMENGNYESAEAFIDERLREQPSQPIMRMLKAALYAQTNRAGEAERILQALVNEDPNREMVWRTLYETKLMTGETEEAREVLDRALEALPDSPDLLWSRAGELERDGDVEGAIAIYEGLYDRLPDSPVLANNLASLISTYRDTPEDLERAYTIARRLRGTDIPAFQDTFGWIALQRGEIREAIDHLEPAAEGLSQDPFVQYHLGMAYSADGRSEAALQTLKRAVEMMGPDNPRRERAKALEEIEKIETQLAEAAAQQ